MSNEFKEMVTKLAKSGSDIKKSLTPEGCHLWHMATGIAGEVGEACEALNNLDKVNLIEELGDIQFYIEGLVQGVDGVDYIQLVPAKTINNTSPIHMLIKSGADILDYVKKHVAYNKRLDVSGLMDSLTKLNIVISHLYAVYDLTHEQVIQDNMNKLMKSKNARYSSGEYSDTQAQFRADKK
jgi:hypothetical protein